MRVVLANTTCKVGGVSTFLLSLRTELVRLGHGCELFFFERGPMEAYLPQDGRASFGTLADLMRLVADNDVDVVHANNVDWPTGISAVRRLGARLVLTAHKVRDPAYAYGWTAKNCDAFVAVSRWIRDGLQRHTDAAVQVVYNGIDTTRFTPGPGSRPGDAPIIAWIGRASAPRKRLEALAAIAPALTGAGCRLWIVDQQGAGEFAQRHPDDAATLRRHADRWEGVPFEQMPAMYREVAASGGTVLSTAAMEGLPLTLLEAQACGCPVIAADVHGVNECVRPEHGGTLYPLDTPPGTLARLVIDAVSHRETARARGERASRAVSANFSLNAMARQYLVLYEAPPSPLAAGRRRARFRQSPLLHWDAYLDSRLGVGYAQYVASHALARSGHLRTAAAAAREALVTAPTMYAHPERLMHLLKLSARLALGGAHSPPAPPSH